MDIQLTQKSIDLPLDLDGNPRGSIEVFEGHPRVQPRFYRGSFLRIGDKLYEVIYMYRLTNDPQTWHYVLEERVSLLSAEADDLLGLLFLLTPADLHINKNPSFLFPTHDVADEFFADVQFTKTQSRFEEPELQEIAIWISSGEVLDNDTRHFRRSVKRVFNNTELLPQVVTRAMTLAEAIEELRAMDMVAEDLAEDPPNEGVSHW